MPLFQDGQKFEDFLKDYYQVGSKGFLGAMDVKREAGSVDLGDIKKILTADETNYYQNAFAQEVQYFGLLNSEIYKVLDKRPITQVGDSFKYTTAHNLVTTGIGPGGATALFAGAPTEAVVATISKIMSPIAKVTLERDLHSMIHENVPGVKGNSVTDWNWISKELAPKALFDKLDLNLGGYGLGGGGILHGVETPCTINIECIDRMISSKAESGAATHVSAATDGDIYWDGSGGGAIKFVRAGATTFDAQIKLPTVPGTNQAYRILDEIDDLMAVAKRYSTNKRYIILTTPAMLNLIQDEFAPGQRYLETESNVAMTVNGLQTNVGHTVGFPVQAVISNGVKMPVFTSGALPTLNSVYSTASAGHLYCIDLDHLFIRVDMPVTYLETGFGVEMLHQDYARSRAMLFTVANLICDKFACHAALKWTAV